MFKLFLINSLVITAAVIFVLSGGTTVYRITCSLEIIFIAFAAYFNFKYFCIQDVEFGIIGSLRRYNLLALMLELLYSAEITLDAFDRTKELP